MINTIILQRVQKQFEADPNLLGNDLKFSEVFTIARILDDIDTSIKALGKIILKDSKHVCYQKLQKAWADFLKNANLPD